MTHTAGGAMPHLVLSRKSRQFRTVEALPALVQRLSPVAPTYFFYPDRLKAKAALFLNEFPGEIAYAVKCNPSKNVLQTLVKAGVQAFDVASIDEIRQVRRIDPAARLYYMNPIKTPEAIHEAYHGHNVRIFVLDHKDELYKIMRETGLAQDLDLFVRLALPKNEKAATDFSSKFGAPFDAAVELLKLARPVSKRLGISFHVGTQSMDADVYSRAISYTRDLVNAAGIEIDALDVGGGFPVPYPDADPAALTDYFAVVKSALQTHGFDKLDIICEPGRAMVAECMDLVARVELRKNDLLYINDGLYGGLMDMAPWLGMTFPVTYVPRHPELEQGENAPFRLTGPTCDSLDMMNGPFMLPEHIKAGDWLVFSQTGAYSQAVRTPFNGFGACDVLMIKGKVTA